MWERRPGGRGPCLPLVSQSPKPFYPEGARTDTRNPIRPSCLPCGRITGIHPVSQSPPPPCPGPQAPASCRVTAIWMSTWAELEGPPGAAGARGLGQARRGEGAGRMCPPLAVPGGASRAAGGGRWVRSRPVVRRLCQQSARTLVLPQWPHCSQPPGSLEEVPRPPLPPQTGARLTPWRTGQVRAHRGLPCPVLPSGPLGFGKSPFTHVYPVTTGPLETLGSPPGEGGAPRPSPTPTVVQVPEARKCQWGGRRRPDIFGPVGLIPATTACPTGS